MKKYMKAAFAFLCVVGLAAMLSLGSHAETAAPYGLTKEPSMADGKVTICWQYHTGNGTDNVSYQLEVALDEAFTKQTCVIDSETTSAVVSKDAFGENGGYIYMRVRALFTDAQGNVSYSDYSAVSKYTFVKINKKNFPGLYNVLKNWNCYEAQKRESVITKGNKVSQKVVAVQYTKKSKNNKDGWLDPSEISTIHKIGRKSYSFKNLSVPKYKIPSLEGIEYFSKLKCLEIYGYQKENLTLLNPELKDLNMENFGKKLNIKAPHLTSIDLYDGSAKTSADSRKIRIDAENLTSLTISGNDTKLTLGKMKKLQELELDAIKAEQKTLYLSRFKNLKQVTLRFSDFTKIDAGNCKKLQELYCYQYKYLNSINLKHCNKLEHVGSYSCPKLTDRKVSLPKGKKKACRINKGLWW